MSKFAALDISTEALAESERAVKETFPSVSFLALTTDITKLEQVEDAFSKTIAQFGRLDYAVNNAGIGQALLPTDSIAPTEYDRVMDVNLKGLWHCEKFELQHMLKQEPLPSTS